jgi:ribonuclease D
MNTGYQMVRTLADIENVVETFRQENILAVDLEADSMYHFQEKVCLIQMGSRQHSFVIDPLEVSDLSSLKPMFADPVVRKIFHGADYDVRSLFRDFGIEIRNLFDTELASRFLGVRESGLEAVLVQRFGVKLNKKFQKKDWSRRPLPEAMIAYAAEDVKYLIPLAEMLEQELAAKGRISWVREEFELLAAVRSAGDDGEPLFLRFKGAGRLGPRTLAVLESLLQLRRDLAEKRDRPLFKVLGNDSLMILAVARPSNLGKLEKTGALSRKQIQMFGPQVLAAVEQAMDIPEADLPHYPRKRAPNVKPDVPQRLQALKAWRDETAQRLDLDPGLVCNKALLTDIAMRVPLTRRSLENIQGMKNWQRREFGKEIVAVMKAFKG